MDRPVILLHGWTMRGAVFDALRVALPAGLRGLAPDLPGHGAAPPAWPMLDVAAEQVQALVAAHPGALLVGWSMGAAVAWRMVERHGCGGLSGLVTVDMSPRLANGAGWRHGLLGQSAADVARTTERIETDWPGTAGAVAATMFADRAGPAHFPRERALRQILSNDPAVMRRCWAELAGMDLRAAAGQVAVPYLVARGGRSRVYPASAADWLAAQAPEARVHGFAASGHSPPLEEPREMARVLGAFAEGL
ncbi:alpha/beta fold hydrolase [Psychromarinibacter sp. C21-152]|uniref:Alpha/beta fold hydrolase n=1 Tax=Psychromarinibacter sediminicola TaxID=3033385 RepID=A0AAE3T6T4_9RHOB|nr:alpha/beta fold hydrolase [Psychromarinibacter sediminicola]MDF0599645.1 alpha/beta fold hydrolase [Psychromarinibacter sediminicola]